jgi:hypothetical protein
MFYLVKTSGLDSLLFVGNLENGIREGNGIQYFPNGYKYSGEWKSNKAHGIGKLEYTDGTFYEGTFKENRFVEGVLSFYNGAKFVGTFGSDERNRERFEEGTFIFVNGDTLKATWNNGLPRDGKFITKTGKVTILSDNERSFFLDEEDPTKGKIIMANSTEIYEGGIKEKEINNKGIIYSSFPHYEEAFYSAGKLNGSFICNYIHGGYCYEGNFKNGQRVGKWKYQTSKGLFYEGEANLKSGKVSFPYLNDDFFTGDVDIQFHNITLLNGVYNVLDLSGKLISLNIQPGTDLQKIPEIKDRRPNQKSVLKRFQSSKIVVTEPILNGVHKYNYPDGSYFRGNFNYDFIYIHKKDLLDSFFTSNSPKKLSHHTTTLVIQNVFCYLQRKSFVSDIEFPDGRSKLIMGNHLNSKTIGFGNIISNDLKILKGLFVDSHLSGPGKFMDKEGSLFIGNFNNGLLDGQGMVLMANTDTVIGSFINGVMQEDMVLIKKQNGLIYNGSIRNLKKHGKGELIYTNGFKYNGHFKDGEIDTSEHRGLIISPQNDTSECVYTTLTNRNMGILETIAEGDVFVYNNNRGSIKKAQ